MLLPPPLLQLLASLSFPLLRVVVVVMARRWQMFDAALPKR
jgi:hypothetical protein